MFRDTKLFNIIDCPSILLWHLLVFLFKLTWVLTAISLAILFAYFKKSERPVDPEDRFSITGTVEKMVMPEDTYSGY